MVPALIAAASAWYMAGLSWFVGVVHYPLFAEVGPGPAWARYHDEHRRRTGIVVAPVMIAELAAAAWLALDRPDGVSGALALAGLVLAAGTWASTFGLSVPDHERLGRGWDAAVGARLVRLHHVRSVLWVAHGVVALAALAQA